MADTFGAITLPAALDITGDPDHDNASDPLLDFALLYFQAILNTKLGGLWRSIAPDQPMVRTVNANDPEEIDFNLKDLPCLYAWRAGSGDAGPDRAAEDIFFMRDQVMLFWVPQPARQAFRSFREQITAGISKALFAAIELGRDPCWVLKGDPDPLAATYGSVFPRFAGWSEMRMGKWQDRVMTVQMDEDAPPKKFPALYCVLDIVEVFQEDITKAIYPPLGGDPYDAGLSVTLYDPTGTLIVDERSL